MLQQWLFHLSMGVLALAIALGLARRTGRIPVVELGLAQTRLRPRARVGAIAACVAFLLLISWLFFPDDPRSFPEIDIEPRWLRLGLHFLTLVALPAFFEELLFRGALQRALTRLWDAPTAIFLASMLFASLHVEPQVMAFAFVMGLCLGLLVHRSGSIRESIVVHALNHTLAFVSQIA